MINLAENGARCECGSSALGPQRIEPGAICICATCGRTWRVQPVALAALPWQAAAAELDDETFEQFEWLRGGVPRGRLRDAAFPLSPALALLLAAGALAVSFAIALAGAWVLS